MKAKNFIQAKTTYF